MTLKQLYQTGKMKLMKAELESPAFDAICLFSSVFALDRHQLALYGERLAEEGRAELFLARIARRAEGEPLQYILGEWEFMGMPFAVGPGVLVPREDTRVLVDAGVDLVRAQKKEAPVVYDLCAGSGAVAVGLLQHIPHARVWCFEYSQAVMPYLLRNLTWHAPAAKICRLDVLHELPPDELPKPDVILSNPPYIPAADLPGLSREVRREPVMALDGGVDGLDFYRAIAGKWCALLPTGGCAAVEIGIGQGKEVQALFEANGMKILTVREDMAGIARAIAAEKSQ